VGHTVVNEILTHWTKYENAVPSAELVEAARP